MADLERHTQISERDIGTFVAAIATLKALDATTRFVEPSIALREEESPLQEALQTLQRLKHGFADPVRKSPVENALAIRSIVDLLEGNVPWPVLTPPESIRQAKETLLTEYRATAVSGLEKLVELGGSRG